MLYIILSFCLVGVLWGISVVTVKESDMDSEFLLEEKTEEWDDNKVHTEGEI